MRYPTRAIWAPVAAVISSMLLVFFGYLWKLSCTGPSFGPGGVSPLSLARGTRDLCLTDIQLLWNSRDLGSHVFPYLTGYFDQATNTLGGGTVEYPVLGGVWIWLSSLPASTDAEFLLSNAVVFAVCAGIVTVLLYLLAGKRAWMWAAAPALVFYAVYNWDIPPVLLTVAALAVVQKTPWSLRTRVFIAAALLGLGGAVKLYPILLVLPLALWVLTGAGQRHAGERVRSGDIRDAVATGGIAGGVMLAANLPFMALGYEGWKAALDFQSHRLLSADTMSIWYWGLRPFGDPSSARLLPLFNLGTAAVMALGVALICFWALRVSRRTGEFPWLACAGAIICAYMVLGKVNSPQYILWLIPFLVVAGIRYRWVLTYYVIDVAIFVGWFRSNYEGLAGEGAWWWGVIFQIALWARAAILVTFVFFFFRAAQSRHDTFAPDIPQHPREKTATA